MSDVLIVGGGAIGICSAHYLNQAGFSVTVLEKSEVGGACSHGNAGLIVPSHVVPLAAPGVISQGLKWLFNSSSPFYIKPRLSSDLISWIWRFRSACSESRMRRSMPIIHELIQASLPLFDELAAIDDLSFGYRKEGLLMLFAKEKGRQDCLKGANLARGMGMPVEELDQEALRALEPHVPDGIIGGVYYPQDAHLDPGRFVTALAAKLRQKGQTTIHTQTEVTELVEEQGKIVAVRTNQGEFTADQILLAGGSWSPLIARTLGLKLPVQAAKGYSITLPDPTVSPRIPMILAEAKATVTPLENQIRFAGTLELAGLDPSINRKRVASILKAAPTYFPDFRAESVSRGQIWSGFRPCTPDGLPMIGRSDRFDNLLVATGHAMIGITLAPITGKIISEIAAEQSVQATSAQSLADLSVERFSA